MVIDLAVVKLRSSARCVKMADALSNGPALLKQVLFILLSIYCNLFTPIQRSTLFLRNTILPL